MKTLILTTFIFLMGMAVPRAEAGNTLPDSSSRVFQEKQSGRPSWEYWVSAPLWIAASPWIILNKGVEKSIGYVDDNQIIPAVKRVLISKDETRIIMPTHSSPIGSGIRYLKKDLLNPGSELNFIATYGFSHRHSLSLDWQKIQLPVSTLYAGITTGYQLKTDEAWYGTGPAARFDNGASYALRQFYGQVTVERPLSKKVILGIRAGISHTGVENAVSESDTYILENFNRKSLPGISDEISLVQSLLRLGFDNRNKKGNPGKGWELEFSTGSHSQIGGGDFGYWETSLDISKYIHLFYDRTLALRLEGRTMRAFSGKEIPFYSLSELGVKETIRAFTGAGFTTGTASLARRNTAILCGHPGNAPLTPSSFLTGAR
jgi:hypothetical protein